MYESKKLYIHTKKKQQINKWNKFWLNSTRAGLLGCCFQQFIDHGYHSDAVYSNQKKKEKLFYVHHFIRCAETKYVHDEWARSKMTHRKSILFAIKRPEMMIFVLVFVLLLVNMFQSGCIRENSRHYDEKWIIAQAKWFSRCERNQFTWI